MAFIHNHFAAAICGKLFNLLTIAAIIRVCVELLAGCSIPQCERQPLHISLSVCTSISQAVCQSVSQSVWYSVSQSVPVLCHAVLHAGTVSTALHYAHFLLTSSYLPHTAFLASFLAPAAAGTGRPTHAWHSLPLHSCGRRARWVHMPQQCRTIE